MSDLQVGDKQAFSVGQVVFVTGLDKSNRFSVGEQFFEKYGIVNAFMPKINAYDIGFPGRQKQIVPAENCVWKVKFPVGSVVRYPGVGDATVKAVRLSAFGGIYYVIESKLGVFLPGEYQIEFADYKATVKSRIRAAVVQHGGFLLEEVCVTR